MTLDLRDINIAIEITCLLFSSVLLVSMLITGAHKTRLTRILAWMLVANCGALLFDAAAWAFAGRMEPYVHPLLVALNLAAYTTSYIQMALASYYVVTYISVRRPGAGKPFLRVFFAFSAALLGLVVVSQFNGAVYHINAANLFVVGPLYSLSFWLAIALMVSLAGLVLRHRKSFEGRDFIIILLFPLSTIAANFAEMLFVDLMFVYVMTAITLMLLFMTVQYQQEKRAAERENQAKISIMLSQIQPHFVYNTLSTITYLCERDGAMQAGKTVHEFSEYLRGNMNALSYKCPIPFAKELEHTQLYLSLEQQQYENRLEVELDIRATNFAIPALTLQPIVENAVKHGTGKRDEGGRVTLRSTEEETHWRVTVTDNGVGFDTEGRPPDGRAHIGIENVRYRLESLCGGTLTIQSEPGVGTRAVITIPKEAAV